MKAITLTQPWATLVALGAKRIETRSWATRYRGPLAIHAAKGLGPVGGVFGLREQCRVDAVFYRVLRNHITGIRGEPLEPADVLPRGKIIAVCNITGISMIGNLPDGTATYMAYDEAFPVLQAVQEPELSFGNYEAGRYAWLLSNIRALPEPIPAKGALGLWEWDAPAGLL